MGSNDKSSDKITVRRRRTAPVRQATFESGRRSSRSQNDLRGTAACKSFGQAYSVSKLSDFRRNNRKYDPPFQVTAEKLSGAIYSPKDFWIQPQNEWLSESRTAIPRSHTQQGGCQITQSERDWAETLDRLKHGENPAAVQVWLEHKRQDKHDPVYYAALTVRKAVAELERRRAPPLSVDLC